MAKSKSDIPLGGAEQNMSREELAAVAKAVAALSPEDRDLLAAVQESPYRLTTAEQFLDFEKNPWQHDRPQAKQADRKPSIRERLEQSKQECRNKNKAQAPRKGKPEPEL